ncbi:arylsulfatase [Bradyrhizobium sp. CCGB12]|uniref:arylsulfatase n=1 Tax=Bradyrhizobium sp. CCGB12 TaxID=2949632 RepID=UPI0020B32107|nr:arylsulfatase [Bradyrhizobium sp. CCGB12]MCP3391081.1 arylsulfatase [Bradyrhizobium sp. CCGB12]
MSVQKEQTQISTQAPDLDRRRILLGSTALAAASALSVGASVRMAQAQQPVPAQPTGRLPNVLAIMADDIGVFNVSAYHHGLMGGRTPNIDRIAGRAAFITGQIPMRTGLTAVGLPGAPQGLMFEDPTLADLLKPLGYVTAQIGKNHLGDRNEFLPTVHGFDEFYGNLYHLNAEEEPEQVDYPKNDPAFQQKFGPRGVLDCKATEKEDATVDQRFGRVGKQTIRDSGPLTSKRMETVEDDLLQRSLDFMARARDANKPFFLWHNTTRMHVFTHLSDRWKGKTKYGLYADGMMELDFVVGELLKKLDELGLADNTIVIFTTDNGAEKFSWPDGGTTPFRGEKGLGWEGGFRVPFVMRWPGRIPAGQVLNGIFSLEDVVPTVMAAAGVPDVKEKLLTGYKAGDKSFKVHLDGYNQLPYLSGQSKESARREFFYYGEANLYAIRVDDWKIHFQVKDNWFAGQLETPTVPRPVNLRVDPFEQHMEAPYYPIYAGQKLWTVVPAQAFVNQHLQSFKAFPQRQNPAGFNLGDAVGQALRATSVAGR